MSKFKVGDSVIVTYGYEDIAVGIVISSFDSQHDDYMIAFEDAEDDKELMISRAMESARKYDVDVDTHYITGYWDWTNADIITPNKVRNTKLARKLNPSYREDGDWLWVK